MRSHAVAAIMALSVFAQEAPDYWGSGVSRTRAVISPLLNFEEQGVGIDFRYYYPLSDEEELHGDIVLLFGETEMWPYIEYGLCFAAGEDGGLFDCMRVRTTIDVDALANEVDELTYDTIEDFEITDMHSVNNAVLVESGQSILTYPDQIY